MIILIEGHRHSGKTFLMEKFFEENKDPKIHYYKFQFAKYIESLGLRDQEDGPGVHYFSIANVLTILELNQSILKDQVIVFDRCIFSAYVWSIYRERMDNERLTNEFRKILNSWDNTSRIFRVREENLTSVTYKQNCSAKTLRVRKEFLILIFFVSDAIIIKKS